MSESLIVKDGNGNVKNLQVNSGSNGYISNHTVVSTADTATEGKYWPNKSGGWQWNSTVDCTVQIAGADANRKALIIHNSGSIGNCYILLRSASDTTPNNGFGTISNISSRPDKYTFVLEAGSTYFGDESTAALKHSLFVPSSSLLTGTDVMHVSVTEVK